MFNSENDRRGGNEVALWAPPPIIGIVIRNRSWGLPEPQCVHLMSDPAAGQLKHRELEETPPINWHKRPSSWIQTNPNSTWHKMYLGTQETQLLCYFVMRCGEDMNDVYSKFYYFEAVGASNDNTLSDPNWQQLHSAQLFTIHSALIQTWAVNYRQKLDKL